MVGPNDGYCRGLINRFSEEFGVQTEYIRLVDESKIVVLIVAGNEYLPDLVIASQEKALDLARTGALVDMAPLLAQAGVDIDSLPPENRRYPAVYEGKQLFFRVPSRVPVDLYVALLKGEKVNEAFELAYYLAMQDKNFRSITISCGGVSLSR